jgi:hypothetical protein
LSLAKFIFDLIPGGGVGGDIDIAALQAADSRLISRNGKPEMEKRISQ